MSKVDTACYNESDLYVLPATSPFFESIVKVYREKLQYFSRNIQYCKACPNIIYFWTYRKKKGFFCCHVVIFGDRGNQSCLNFPIAKKTSNFSMFFHISEKNSIDSQTFQKCPNTDLWFFFFWLGEESCVPLCSVIWIAPSKCAWQKTVSIEDMDSIAIWCNHVA